jgi:hypothetical protein
LEPLPGAAYATFATTRRYAMPTKKAASKTKKRAPKTFKELTPRKNPKGGARTGSKLLVK